MQIPKRFTLHGQQIEVVYDSNVSFRNDNRGEAQFRVNRIALAPSTETEPRPDTHTGQTFCHELLHFIAHHAGVEISERDTDLMGHLLHQYFLTSEYD